MDSNTGISDLCLIIEGLDNQTQKLNISLDTFRSRSMDHTVFHKWTLKQTNKLSETCNVKWYETSWFIRSHRVVSQASEFHWSWDVRVSQRQPIWFKTRHTRKRTLYSRRPGYPQSSQGNIRTWLEFLSGYVVSRSWYTSVQHNCRTRTWDILSLCPCCIHSMSLLVSCLLKKTISPTSFISFTTFRIYFCLLLTGKARAKEKTKI